MSTQPKITIKKRGKVWDVECPHCFKPHGVLYIFGSFTSAVTQAHRHMKDRHTTHRPYIKWVRREGKPVGLCTGCGWRATDQPFSAAAQHLRESK